MKIILRFIVIAFIYVAVANGRQSNVKAVSKETDTTNLTESVWYVLHADTGNLSGYDVTMFIYNAPANFQLAMATHHEYDDRFWRYVENFRVETDSGKAGGFIRRDSALWQVSITDRNAIISYRIHLPRSTPGSRPSQRPFLTREGGLVGGIQSFMYIVGQPGLSSHVTFQLPSGWRIATGLEPTNSSTTFFAPNARFLLDCPVLIGQFWDGYFNIEGVPHRVVYWPSSHASSFDTLLLKNTINRIVQQAVNLFGVIPYRDYTFLLQDNAFGALEHLNSVSIGAPDTTLATDMADLNGEIAHEFFHTWNLMRMRPVEYSDVNYGPQEQSAGLWWSEGLTMFYADLILRRAGLPAYDSTRVSHLERLITGYFSSPGNTRFSPEQVSLASNTVGSLGDYSASVHLQGELIGAMLDLIVRGATGGQHSMDDVMRKMFERYKSRGFSGNDIERTVTEVCNCNVHGFFDDNVHGTQTVDFNAYLKIIGLNLTLSWVTALNPDGSPAPDLRVYSWQPADGSIRLGIIDPAGCWGKAGLHTNDQILSVNGSPIKNTKDFRAMLNRSHIGGKLMVAVQGQTGTRKTTVTLSGYKLPKPVIRKINGTTTLQQRLFDQWFAGNN